MEKSNLSKNQQGTHTICSVRMTHNQESIFKAYAKLKGYSFTAFIITALLEKMSNDLLKKTK
jgi:uncharacterized protein (DUF1778 family)